MKPKVLVLVQGKFKKDLLPDCMTDRLGSFADYELLVDGDKLSQDEFVRHFKGVDGILTSWEIRSWDREVLQQTGRLKIISHIGGMVRFFLPEEIFTLKPEVVICNSSNVMAKPVAEYALCSSLACLRHLWYFREWVAQGENWDDYEPDKNVSLLRKKVGVIGLGQIAREFIRLARPFKVSFHVFSKHLSDEEARKEGFVKSSLDDIFSSCDVIILCAANTPENRHMISRRLLKRIKPGAVFVNIARGALVDEQALIQELETGRFMAAIDVTDPEPPLAENKLRRLPNVLLTPHIAGPTPEQRTWMVEEAVDNLQAFFRGKAVRGVIDQRRYEYMA
ncbi:MAG TPA: hydroxyacid dehydrogenase [archaeon]|nr:hydroxyacid dehydrogenase [archaeon]